MVADVDGSRIAICYLSKEQVYSESLPSRPISANSDVFMEGLIWVQGEYAFHPNSCEHILARCAAKLNQTSMDKHVRKS